VDPAWTPVLAWMFVLALAFVFLPPVTFYSIRRFQAGRRRKMVNAPRKIKVLSGDETPDNPCAKGHQRSKRNARQGSDGAYVSVCRTCGARMRRVGPGDWEVAE
jgi:hypothetical protein